MRYNTLFLLFTSIIVAQSDSQQIEIKTITKLNIPYAGKITLSGNINATNGLYREEIESEYDRFYVRMMAGGNRKAGKIIKQFGEVLIMYDIENKEYASEMFEEIRNNSGKPTLKDVTSMTPGGGGNRSNDSESNDSTDDEPEEQARPTVDRFISNDFEEINGFKCRKITTRISRDDGIMQMNEWVTADTAIFIFVNNVEKNLIESYNGTYNKTPSSNDWISQIDPDQSFENISGEVVKSTMEFLDDEGKSSFSMDMEILSAKRVPYDSSIFILPNTYKLVDELD